MPSLAAISPNAMVVSFVRAAGSAQLLSRTAQDIVSAPDLSSPSIPSLADDVRASKANARQWLDPLGPEVTRVIDDIIVFGGIFNTKIAELQTLVPDLGNPATVAAFTRTVTALDGQAASHRSQVNALNQKLDAHREQVELTARALAADTQQANAQILGLQREMQTLGQELAKISSQLKQARSASGIFLRILEDIFTLGLAELANTQRKLESQVDQLRRQLNQLEQQTGQLYAISNALSQLGGLTAQLVNGVTGLSTAFQTLGTNLNEVMTNVSAGSSFVSAQLQQLQSNWQEVLLAAQRLGG